MSTMAAGRGVDVVHPNLGRGLALSEVFNTENLRLPPSPNLHLIEVCIQGKF